MSTLRSYQTIRILASTNPHRWGGPNWVRFNILRNLVRQGQTTVADFVVAHNAAGNPRLGSTFEARRYLRYEVERSEVAIEGFTYARRARQAPISFAAASSTGEFTFGVEIEFHRASGVSDRDLVAMFSVAGIDCRQESLGHEVRTWWKLTTDGSLRNYSTGRELVSPKLQGAEGLRVLAQVCSILTELNSSVDRNCGLHVHVGHSGHDQDARYFGRLLNTYADNEAALDSIMSPSRRGPSGGNGFCGSVRRPSSSLSVESLCRSVGCTGNRSHARYRKLNVDCWFKYKTVEFRQHHGSVDAAKVCNWVQFCLQFCLMATTDRQVLGGQTIAGLMVAMDLAPELQQFFNDRAARYAASDARRRAA